MIKNLFLISIGMIGGFWLVWPGISTNKGWVCARDIVFHSDRETVDSQSLVEELTRKLRISSAVSPKTLFRRKNLGAMDKFRIIGDVCFR